MMQRRISYIVSVCQPSTLVPMGSHLGPCQGPKDSLGVRRLFDFFPQKFEDPDFFLDVCDFFCDFWGVYEDFLSCEPLAHYVKLVA